MPAEKDICLTLQQAGSLYGKFQQLPGFELYL